MDEDDPCVSRNGKRKQRWPNEAAALFVADWKRMKFGDILRAYLCPKCDGWHLATPKEHRNMTSRDRRRERRRWKREHGR